ncbi:MAG: aspartate kinase [Candidatus Cloacimonadaceae bacterium]|nr:aspartate kinase [Candidatus Cloacimonadaceae bacterium]MDP3113725.1 aspartate kinase [Candidatus Cloacimonadaceae bacterium]
MKKFGGTSVGSIDLIQSVAAKIASEHRSADSLVLVVSAMAKTTDDLVRLAYGISDHPSRREFDMLLTAGERISMSLMSLALQEKGFSSISFTGSQSGIMTDDKHGNARILSVNAFRIREELMLGKIVIVAGFQGVSSAKEITTLGRGGSDTSAVALACYLKADRCEIYTDVDGVFTADPRIVPNARLLPSIDYARMLALSYNGSKVIHPRAVEFAYKYEIPVEVKSSFTFASGTIIQKDYIKDNSMEERNISAIAHKENLAKYVLSKNAALLDLFQVWQNEIFKYYVDGDQIELLIEDKFQKEIDYLIEKNGLELIEKVDALGCVNLIGLGINLDPCFLEKTIRICEPFDIKRIQHSEMTIELMLPSDQVQDCVRAVHSAFLGDSK